MTLLSLPARTVTIEVAARQSAHIFQVFLMTVLRTVEIHEARELQNEEDEVEEEEKEKKVIANTCRTMRRSDPFGQLGSSVR